MKNLKEAYKFVNKFIGDVRINDEDKFSYLFIMICELIDIISFKNDKNIKHILQMLNEYDFKKNRGQKHE